MAAESFDPSDSPTSGLSLDSFNPDGTGWTEHEELVGRWKQGDIVTDVPASWLAPAGFDPFSQSEGLDDDAVRLEGVVDVVIVSQTCDVAATKVGGKHPHVMVAPLISASEIARDQDRKNALRGKVGYLYSVPRPDLSEDAEPQYADLRLLMPMSKGFLLEREPVAGLDGAGAVDMSERLAQKFRRAAASDEISERLPEAIRKFLKSNANKPWVAKTEQVRVLVLEGTRLEPTQIQLLVLTKVALTDDEHAAWMGVHSHVSSAVGGQIKCVKPIVTEVTSIGAVAYRESIPVRLDELGPKHWS